MKNCINICSFSNESSNMQHVKHDIAESIGQFLLNNELTSTDLQSMKQFFDEQKLRIASAVVRHNSKTIANILNSKLEGYRQKLTRALICFDCTCINYNFHQTKGLWLEFESYGLLFKFEQLWFPTPYVSETMDYSGNMDYDLCVLNCDEEKFIETDTVNEGLMIMEHLLKYLRFSSSELTNFQKLWSGGQKNIRREIVSDFFENNNITTKLFHQCRAEVLEDQFDMDKIFRTDISF